VRIVTGSNENLGLVGLGEVAAELVVVYVVINLKQKEHRITPCILASICVTESYLHVANKASVEKLSDTIPSISVADPGPYVFGPPGSGSRSSSQRYGSGSFYYQAKIVRKP
jgi:hypothetical protein